MKYIIIAGIVILAIFLAVLSQIPKGIEPLTEMYLENHTDLPKNVYLNKMYNFSFTVRDLEYQNMRYDYTIDVFDVNNTLLFNIADGNFILVNNESKTITENYIFDKSFERAKIEVNITKIKIEKPWFEKKFWWPDPNYPSNIDIHFWVDEIVQTKIIIIPD